MNQTATSDQAPVYSHQMDFRVRYSEIDQLGTFYNSRALEWFECGRVEYLRSIAMPYHEMEARGACLPLITAHLDFLGRAGFDDLLTMFTSAEMVGKARLKFNIEIVHAGSDPDKPRRVVSGYTIHAVTDSQGKPTRTPQWLADAITNAARAADSVEE